MSSRLFTLRSIVRSANAATPLRTSILRPIASTTYSNIQRSNQTTFNNVASLHTLTRLANEEKTPSGETPTGEAASTAGATAADPKIAELSEELKKKDTQIKDLQDKYTRALAEAQNTLTRSQKQIADAKQFAVQSFAKQLLEVADILEIATKAAEPHATASEDANFKNLYEGVTMTQKVLVSTFERNGLKKVSRRADRRLYRDKTRRQYWQHSTASPISVCHLILLISISPSLFLFSLFSSSP